jgi:hypothetical protein
MQTSQIFPVYDTTTQGLNGQPPKTTTQAEHIANILNEFRKLGIDTTNVTTAAQMEAIAGVLAKQRPYFRIRTSVRAARNANETPGVWENWDGIKGVETYGQDVGDSYALAGAADGTQAQPAAPLTNGHAATAPAQAPAAQAAKPAPAARPAPAPAAKPAAAPKPAPAAAKAPPPPPAAPVATAAPTPDELDIDQQDTASLVQLANAKNPAAQRRLSLLATEAGYEKDLVDAAQTWEKVAEMINSPITGEAAPEDQPTEGAEGDADVFLPKETEIYGYFPVDKKTGAVAQAKVEVKILAVNPDARTVDLQNMENKRIKYTGISFGDLTSAD